MIKVPSTIDKIQTMADNTLKFSVVTQELNPEAEAELFKLRNKLGWFVFKENGIEEKDIANLLDFKPKYKGDKSPTAKLRAAIHVYWDQQISKQKPFEEFYADYLEEVRQMVLAKLD